MAVYFQALDRLLQAIIFEQLLAPHNIIRTNLATRRFSTRVPEGKLGFWEMVTNAVGLAVATKHLDAIYNRPGFELLDNVTWSMVVHACLQEDLALEAISLAGHCRLENLAIDTMKPTASVTVTWKLVLVLNH